MSGRRAGLLGLLLGACRLDGQLNPKPDDEPFDSGPPAETAEDTVGETDPPPHTCPEQVFPAGALEVVDTCEPPAHVSGPLRIVGLWTNEAVGGSYTTPTVGRLDDDDGDGDVDIDDHPDVVVGDLDGGIHALDGRDGGVLWEMDPGLLGQPDAAAIGDLDGDGRPEVVVSGATGTGALDGGTGAAIWWVDSVATGTSAVAGGVGLADLEGDGSVEVLLGRTVLSGEDGALIFDGTEGAGTGNGSRGPVGFAADLDLDGLQEVLVGNAAYHLDGEPLWANEQADGYVAPVNADGDDEGELVVCTRGVVRLTDDDGDVRWYSVVDEDNCGPPTLADLDGDGDVDIAVGTPRVVAALDLDGNLLWQTSTNDTSSGWTGLSAFDFDGDGAHELVYTDQVSLYVFDGTTGEARAIIPEHASGTLGEYPVVADVDGDGDADLVFVSAGGFGPEVGVRALTGGDGPWPWARGVWSQHAETSVAREELGEVPARPSPSWLVDDRFHAAGAPARPYEALPALSGRILDVCEALCAEGRITLWYTLGNEGAAEAPAGVRLLVVGETEAGDVALATLTWPDPVPAGTLPESRSADLPVPGPLTGIRLEVDPDDAVAECGAADPGRWAAPVCPGGA